MTDRPIPLAQIAARILAHLRRFEADPKVNRKNLKTGLTPFFAVNVWQGGGKVRVIYVAFQGPSSLTRTKASEYLAWLDAGNIGQHYDLERVSKRRNKLNEWK